MDPNSAQNWNMPTGWHEFLMHGASLVGEFPEFAEGPMVAAPAVPPVAEGSTQAPKSTTKSTNGQRKNSFWSRIAQGYNTKKGSEHPTRTLRSLESRWDFIKEQVAEVITRFNSLEKRPFAVAHCWAMLKDEAKWVDLQDTRSEGGHNIDDDLGLGLDDAGEGVPMVPRVMMKAPRPGRGPWVETPPKKLGSELLLRQKARDPNKLVDIKERKAQVEAQCLHMEEWKEEERIMSMDLSTLNPLHRTLIEKRRRDIATCWASEE
ncbi:hypothetical protein BAE44_0001334 [Dichanthelium oligosanthes]|uniref:No apical meristem-associated C-terminal domain-containing protein n=1 Tax=Dichanthelium oligosanthes TaxID=888268 RepID=A0A1E5WJT0_9POAL|nr:hypothetical protein BAE44_0001334 [Dichanthelium oligosanthes]